MEFSYFAILLLYSVNSNTKHFIIETKDSVSPAVGSDNIDDKGEDYRMKYSKGYWKQRSASASDAKTPESDLPNGKGSVKAWYQAVDCLEPWERNLKLGDAYLQTSAKSECARARFTLGLLSLHNFQYDQAIELFEKARSDELSTSGREYPMALWGAAMATTMILWQYSDCEKGKSYTEQIPQKADWLTEKEAAYIGTLSALYPSELECSADTNQNKRENRFMEALKMVTEKFPGEVEAGLFYGVTRAATFAHPECKGSSSESTSMNEECFQEMETDKDVFKNLYKSHPTHSGLVHYIIHIFDTPDPYYSSNERFTKEMIKLEENHPASLGIKASYNYLNIASSSCHGLHMPSHIFMRLGNWKMSLKANLLSIKACDSLAEQRGFDHTYDAGNLYHSIENAQNDYLQIGNYEKANELLVRQQKVVALELSAKNPTQKVKKYSQLSNHVSNKQWESAGERLWEMYRMYARQIFESYGEAKFYSYDVDNMKPKVITRSVIHRRIPDGKMNYAALAEAGMILTNGMIAAKECATDKKKSCAENKELNKWTKKFEDLITELKPRTGTYDYVKYAVKMLNEILLGVRDLAEYIRPYGLNCFVKTNCTKMNGRSLKRIQEMVLNGHLKAATDIQRAHMKQTPSTPTLLFMPSYEIYGHILLFLDQPRQAQNMFETSLKERMGRTQSLIGLARSHSMQDKKKADFFYGYIKDQLKNADKIFGQQPNLYVEEADAWLNGKINVKNQRDLWQWPYC